MGKKKDVLSVDEAKQQLLESIGNSNLIQSFTKNLGTSMLVCFIAGILTADSVKAKEGIVDFLVSVIKKYNKIK